MATSFRSGRRPGFTLVELLVVIGIIVVLASLLVPTLARVRETAREVKCRSNLRQLMAGFLAFAADHDRNLPGGYFDIQDPDRTRQCWLMGGNPDWREAPKTGTLFPYIMNRAIKEKEISDKLDLQQYLQVYRCPSLTEAPGTGPQGKTSNGRFDYTTFTAFAGARLDNVPQTSRFRPPGATTQFKYLPTPVLCEEDTKHLNVGNMESGHSNTDQMGHHHRGGGHYASIDGSVHWFVEDDVAGTDSLDWSSQAPSGRWRPIGLGDIRFGWWNSQ